MKRKNGPRFVHEINLVLYYTSTQGISLSNKHIPGSYLLLCLGQYWVLNDIAPARHIALLGATFNYAMGGAG